MLTIVGVVFKENTKTRDTAFFFNNDNGKFKIGLSIDYLCNIFEDEECRPSLNINSLKADTRNYPHLSVRDFLLKILRQPMNDEIYFICLNMSLITH